MRALRTRTGETDPCEIASPREVGTTPGHTWRGQKHQARFLANALGVPLDASDDLLREHRRLGTPRGLALQGFMNVATFARSPSSD